MSVWTHVTGTIRTDSFDKTDYNRVFNDGLPTGSEGSLHYKVFKENSLTKTVCFYGDLRDFYLIDCSEIRDWWMRLPSRLSEGCSIRQGILQINTEEDDISIVLTDKDMIKENSDE